MHWLTRRAFIAQVAGAGAATVAALQGAPVHAGSSVPRAMHPNVAVSGESGRSEQRVQIPGGTEGWIAADFLIPE